MRNILLKCFPFLIYISSILFYIVSNVYLHFDLIIASNLQHQITVPLLHGYHVICWLRNLNKTERNIILDSCNNHNFSSFSIDNKNDDLSKKRFCVETLSLWKNFKVTPCWGYEVDSDPGCLLYKPICDGPSESWASDKKEQMKIFFTTADFGYVRQQNDELKYYCSPNNLFPKSSHLKCTKYMRFCQAKNIYIDFKNLLHLKEPIRYKENILNYGDIGGWNCNLTRSDLLKEGGHKSPLMSWFAEISNFKILPNEFKCDEVIKKPTFIMKLDATINMYHHFCDFINLYLSFHINGSFYLDNNILIWDTHPYRSNFAPVWKAFTKNALLDLSQFKGKVVCFENVIFPLLPRMIYGLYYNMPLIPGCRQSGVFRAFNRHLLFHLNLNDSEILSLDDRIKITFLKRNTKYRKILNQNELIKSLRETLIALNQTKIEVQLVDFNHQIPFIDQIRISSSSDILIGIHGAGLTHTLFQPDYGLLFELYNCGDRDCYKDLARLRGVDYMTWQDQTKLQIIVDESQKVDQLSTGAAHEKFVDYYFDKDEFVEMSLKGIEIVRRRKKSFYEKNVLKYTNQIKSEFYHKSEL